MPYWGGEPSDSDFAFDGVGAYIVLIKKRTFQSASTVIEKSYPEQSIIASLRCLRVLANEFPKCVRLHFRRKQFEEAKTAFETWYELVEDKLPAQYKESIRLEADREFELFDEQVLRS